MALAAADLVIAVDVQGFGSLDWRRSDELIARGYEAAERMRESLLKYQASDEQWQAWLAAREQRRRTSIPNAEFLATAGIGATDAGMVRRTLERYVGVPLDVPALQEDLSAFPASIVIKP